MIAVGVLYVFSTNLILSLRRRKEFAILLSLGWRIKDLWKLIFIEALMMSLFVIGISCLTLFLFFIRNERGFQVESFIQIALVTEVIYFLGALWPAMLLKSIQPYEAIRTGEVMVGSKRMFRVRGLPSMALGHFLSKIKRNLLSILAIAIPAVLLSFFIFVTFRMEGVLYTTALGNYISVQISSIHYISMAIAALLSILTTMELIWQNVSDRRHEITVLRSIGWRNANTRMLVYWEGIFVGTMAAVLGVTGALALIWSLYEQFPLEHLGVIALTRIIPVMMGLVGSFIPGEIAVRMNLKGVK
ncbi:FtsX-like permease family protein [Halobacillus yeomjeoni]|uniref:FtsX-like permease family protein n=1 Tax=Halobacillus yeomjeoni TaxID=311194 RepID=A0A931HXQ4_9BACI|nr:FtsX-like permease family protein [Halobacillus yeomjeoni]MBH0231364.1 FtsX-like permease family protein [Halobacillus yeomjeoni]